MSEEITVTRPSFWALADDLAAYTETLAMIEADLQHPHDPTEIEILRKDEEMCRADIERIGAELATKTDSFAGVIRRLQSDAAIQREESDRMAARAKASERAEQWLRDYGMRVMDEHGWKHLKTVANTIAIRGNGGVQPLVIDAPDKVPDELCWMEGRIRADLWRNLCDEVPGLVPESEGGYRFERAPSNTLIREALAQECRCVGPELSEDDAMPLRCPHCGGRTRQVPGAHLEPRGRHLRLS